MDEAKAKAIIDSLNEEELQALLNFLIIIHPLPEAENR